MSTVQFTGVTNQDYVNTLAGATTSSNTLTMDDFYELLAAQLKYQDADNPMDSSEMMDQMVQMEMMDATNSMVAAIQELTFSNLTSYATSLMGQEVTIAEVDPETGEYIGSIKGVVEGVSLGSYPTVVVNGKQYSVTQVMGVGTVPELEGETDSEEGTGDTDTVVPEGGTDIEPEEVIPEETQP